MPVHRNESVPSLPATKDSIYDALAHHEAGRLREAEQAYIDLLREDPEDVNALQLYGTLCLGQRRDADAERLLTRAIALLPTRASFHSNLGSALRNQNRLAEAVVAYEAALTLDPEFAGGCLNLGLCLQDLGRYHEAVVHLKRAIELQPDEPKTRCCLARCYQTMGHIGSSVETLKEVMVRWPNHSEAWMLAGMAYQAVEQAEDAERLYRRAILLGESAHSQTHLGDACRRQGRYEEAVVAYERACTLSPNFVSPRIRLATMSAPIWPSGEDQRAGRRAIEQRVDDLSKWTNTFANPEYIAGQPQFFYAYHGVNDRPLQEALGAFYRRCCPSLNWVASHCQNMERTPGKIRIGVVSAFFDGNTIGRLWNRLIQKLDRDAFEVHLYAYQDMTSEEGKRLCASVETFRRIPRSAIVAREMIAEDELDVLWYPEIGMDIATYFLAFARIAPVQCVSWGHPMTTGIDTVDYFLSSEHMERDGSESHYSETLVKMKSVMAWFEHVKAPEKPVSPVRFGLPSKATLYGCLQSLFKFHPEYDQMWGEILRRDPNGILVLLEGRQRHWTDALRLRLTKANPDVAHRIVFVPRMDRTGYLALLHTCHVVLDTPVFGGGNTSLEAFAMGRPLVTLPGDMLRGRITYALYQQMKMTACIAQTVEEYVEIAVTLGTQPELREKIGRLTRYASAPLFENDAVVHELEAFLHDKVRSHWSRMVRAS